MAGLSGQPDYPAPWPEYPSPYLVVTSQDFIKFWGKFFAFVLLEMIGIHRDLKLLSLFESFIRRLF
jgi:hypothetical protein